MQILVLNAGSSSLKYTLYNREELDVVSKGIIEKIGDDGSLIKHTWDESGVRKDLILEQPVPDHISALQLLDQTLSNTVIKDKSAIEAIGHRLVHGGEEFSDPVIIDDEVKEKVRELIPLAPLHNPANLLGVEVSEKVFPDAVQVGVFDTAFYSTIPDFVYRYAIPEEYYSKYRIRVYGFHGTSHKYVSNRAKEYLNNENANLITIHLGNGASVAAIKNGIAMDTSMGISPLPGLVMGTRSGDIDPSIIFHLNSEYEIPVEEIEKKLNKESGLKGLTGKTDLRDILNLVDEGDEMGELAIQIYCYRIKKYIGSFYAGLGKVDAIVFTAGVGENSPVIRSRSLTNLESMGIEVDEQLNNDVTGGNISQFHKKDSKVKLLVIPTDEEKQIALEVLKLTQ